jgi:hypothetical protein
MSQLHQSSHDAHPEYLHLTGWDPWGLQQQKIEFWSQEPPADCSAMKWLHPSAGVVLS